jgi:hypothetical protein
MVAICEVGGGERGRKEGGREDGREKERQENGKRRLATSK